MDCRNCMLETKWCNALWIAMWSWQLLNLRGALEVEHAFKVSEKLANGTLLGSSLADAKGPCDSESLGTTLVLGDEISSQDRVTLILTYFVNFDNFVNRLWFWHTLILKSWCLRIGLFGFPSPILSGASWRSSGRGPIWQKFGGLSYFQISLSFESCWNIAVESR